MKTECTIKLFFGNQCMDVQIYLDLSESIEPQVKAIYGNLVDDYVLQAVNF